MMPVTLSKSVFEFVVAGDPACVRLAKIHGNIRHIRAYKSLRFINGMAITGGNYKSGQNKSTLIIQRRMNGTRDSIQVSTTLVRPPEAREITQAQFTQMMEDPFSFFVTQQLTVGDVRVTDALVH